MYSKKQWLNKYTSPSTSNVVAFDGNVDYSGEVIRSTFLKISDCHNIVKLHVAEYDTIDDFIEKMKLIRNEIDLFIDHLETKKQ